MNYSSHTIKFVKSKEELDRDLDLIFPKGESKRKSVFRLIADGMTVADWLAKVAAAGYKKVNVSYVTACYGIDDPNRYVRKLVDLIPPPS